MFVPTGTYASCKNAGVKFDVFGNIDYGPDIPLDKAEDTVANESLTVMLVGYKKY